MNHTKRWGFALMGCGLAAWPFGCVAGPAALKVSRAKYNEAIQKTRKEQLLLNLVRLQYREEPLFLDVGSIAAQFSFRESADVSGIVNEGPHRVAPDRLDINAGVTYEERPTITLTPLQGEDFAKRLLAPLPLNVIGHLTRSGWSIDRVLRLTVQSMNGLDNASSASGPTPRQPPRYETFARVCSLFRTLQKAGLLQLGYETRPNDLSIPLPVERVEPTDLIEAANHGYRFRATEDGGHVVLTGDSSVLVWRIPPPALQTDEVREIVELLDLVPGRSRYELKLGISGHVQGPSGSKDCREITITTRSLMGTLFYLSQAVEVPRRHRDHGLVTTTLDASSQPFDWTLVTGDLLRVHSQRTPPTGEAVAVRHWGYWYYIDNADLTSKSTLALLGQLFALQAGGAEGAAPVLTLPVGGG